MLMVSLHDIHHGMYFEFILHHIIDPNLGVGTYNDTPCMISMFKQTYISAKISCLHF